MVSNDRSSILTVWIEYKLKKSIRRFRSKTVKHRINIHYIHTQTHTHTHTHIHIYIYIQIFLYFFFFRDSQFFRLFLYFRFWNKNFKKIGCAIAQQSIVKNSDSSSRLQMFFKTNDLEKFCNIHKKTPLSEYLFNKVALKLFIKKRLQHSNTCIFLWILQNF